MDYNMGPFRIRPRGDFDDTESYRYLDLVYYNGSSFICSNYDTIDGTACIGVLPEGADDSETYWQCVAHKGDTGIPRRYEGFHIVLDNKWDFEDTDKIYIPADAPGKILDIYNVHNGCCGLLITPHKELDLPINSDYSIDFNYVTAGTNQYYLYSFIYMDLEDNGTGIFLWNRTVIDAQLGS